MIAAHGLRTRHVEKQQQIAAEPSLHRTAETIAQIDDVTDAEPRDIVQHRLQRRVISMHIGDDRKAHQLPL